MKKKILNTLAVLCLFIPCLLLSACSRNITPQNYLDQYNLAFRNAYNIVVTNKTDLSENKDFTFTKERTSSNFNTETEKWTKTKTTTVVSRKGTGTNTILKVVTTTESKIGDEEATTSVVEKFFGKILDGEVVKYYELTKTTENNDEAQYQYTIISSEETFIENIFNKSASYFNEFVDDNSINSELLLYVNLYEAKTIQDGNNYSLEINMNDLSYDSSVKKIEDNKNNLKITIADDKLVSYLDTSSSSYNDVQTNMYSKSITYSFTSDIAGMPDLTNYLD